MRTFAVDLQTVFNALLAGFLGLLGLTWKTQDKRIEQLEDECNEQGKSIVRLDAQHVAVMQRLESIENKLDKLLQER